GGLVLDTAKKEVTRDGRVISLTAKEYAILEYMAYNQDTVLSRTKIIEHVYDDSFDLYSNVIDVHINSLRNKIDKGCTDKLISTVRGAGYILRKP
ncbi:MAG: winged helix-turn-helix domain-containing protein, partial [Nitrospirota bacterium]|nr:winged helix-turn-helix domain-containing protein [Nitrospirota bacterium]